MRRTLLLAGLALIVGWTVPAWADHSAGTGINCSNFTTQEDAQAYFNLHPGDPEGLDGPPGSGFTGVPNVACEDLPRRGTTTTVATIPTSTSTTTTTVASGSSGNSGTASNATAQPSSSQLLPAANQVATTVPTTVPVPATAPPASTTASSGRLLALTG